MPFSSGQKNFALIILISFIGMMALAYWSDAKIYKMFYKNVWVVLIGILIIAGGIILLLKITH